MLRDNLVGLIEPMRISAGVDPLALIQKQSSDDRSSCLENPRPEGAESSLTENVTSPFQAEPAHQDIPLAKIRESKTNPRRFFDEAKLAELADNIGQYGVLQPILLRPLPDGEAGMYELVAGARRYRASKLAKRESIPATVSELTDAQALELQVIENVHPLDEAQEIGRASCREREYEQAVDG